MAFDATVGGASATSFLTVEEANALAVDHPFAAPWLAIASGASGTAQKQALLIAATRALNNLCYLGTPTAEAQALKFPMSGLLTRTGYALADSVIPLDLKLATFEMALNLLRSADAPESATVELINSLGLTRIKAGPVELGFKEGGGEVLFVPASVRSLLVPSWLCPEKGTVRRVFEEL